MKEPKQFADTIPIFGKLKPICNHCRRPISGRTGLITYRLDPTRNYEPSQKTVRVFCGMDGCGFDNHAPAWQPAQFIFDFGEQSDEATEMLRSFCLGVPERNTNAKIIHE